MRMHLALILFFLTCACSRNNEQSSSHSFRVFSEDNVKIAETTGGPKYRGEIFDYIVDVVLTPGETEESVLEAPRQFFSDSNGYLYIADESKAAVMVFHPDGQYSHTIGREGYGPGEFQHPRVQEVSDGIVTVFDLPTRRLSRFTFEGNLMETVSAPALSGMLTMNWNTRVYHVTPDGTEILLFRHQHQRLLNQKERVSALFLSADGDTLADIGTAWIETGYPVEMSTIYGSSAITYTLGRKYPYGPQSTCTFNPHVGIVLGNGADPILNVYGLDAELKMEIRLIQEPEPVDTEKRQTMVQAVRDQILSSDDANQGFWQEYLDNLQFPESVAFSSDVEIENSGYIWVKVPEYPTAVAEYADSTWRLFSPEGEFLGITRRPEDDMRNPTGSWRRAYNGRLIILHEDAETGEYLPTVYRIRPIVEGLEYPQH
ncbi:6-bladed beta-propeller [Gemmatimonadota bacterium]